MLGPLVDALRLRKGVLSANGALVQAVRHVELHPENMSAPHLLVVAGLVPEDVLFPLSPLKEVSLLLPERARWEAQLHSRPVGAEGFTLACTVRSAPWFALAERSPCPACSVAVTRASLTRRLPMRHRELLGLSADPATSEALDEEVIHDLVGGRADVIGPWQVGWLERHGMGTESRVLDLGCGTLRGGIPIMARLRPGHYTGVEPLSELLGLGRFLVVRHGLTDHRPSLHTLEEWDADASGHGFDFVLTQSVLNHLDAASIGRTIDRVATALVADGRWLTTVAVSESVEGVDCGRAHPWREGEWWRTVMHPEWFTKQALARGLELIAMPDIDHPAGLTTAVLRRR